MCFIWLQHGMHHWGLYHSMCDVAHCYGRTDVCLWLHKCMGGDTACHGMIEPGRIS
jgi:hypothetical protein